MTSLPFYTSTFVSWLLTFACQVIKMCFNCNLSAGVREKLAIAIGVLNCSIALFGIALIGMAIYMKISIESRMTLLDGYDTGVLPHFLLAVGIKVVVFHVITFKIVYDCSSYESSRNCVNFLFLAVILSFILVWFLLAGGIMCFSHCSVIEESLQNGLNSVMKRYKTDMPSKVTLDKLQQEYYCCGSNGYSDWFDINWVNEESLNMKHPDIIRKLKGGLFYTDDVPYSCCDVGSIRPCVHHAVKDKSKHVHYGSVTLYKAGCSGVLMDFIENKVLVPTGWSVMTAFFLQFLTVVLMRYLQTSLSEAWDMEDPMGYGTGYCIPGCPCQCCSGGGGGNPMKYIKREPRTGNDVERGMNISDSDFDYDDNERHGSRDRSRKDKKKERKDKSRDRKNRTRNDVEGGMNISDSDIDYDNGEKHGSRKDKKKSKKDKKKERKDKSRDRKDRSRDRKEKSKDRKSRSRDRKDKEKDQKSRSRERKDKSKDRKSRSRERKDKSKDRKSRSQERNSKSKDRKSRSRERKGKSKDRKSRSRERKSKSKDRKSRSRERKGKSKDRKSRSRERKSRSRERKSRSRKSKSPKGKGSPKSSPKALKSSRKSPKKLKSPRKTKFKRR
ncbi:uncharacterized protein [Argopecten irradians]|uniref:uncharacterized protein n=1 Tax=Argopecten irradians TaxID=31199 RepID=UPI003712C0FE